MHPSVVIGFFPPIGRPRLRCASCQRRGHLTHQMQCECGSTLNNHNSLDLTELLRRLSGQRALTPRGSCCTSRVPCPRGPWPILYSIGDAMAGRDPVQINSPVAYSRCSASEPAIARFMRAWSSATSNPHGIHPCCCPHSDRYHSFVLAHVVLQI